MILNRRGLLRGAAALPVLGVASHSAAAAPDNPWDPANWTRPAYVEPDLEIDLWPEGTLSIPDGLDELITQRSDDPLASDRILERTIRPRLAVFLPENPNGASAVIAPGGGYRYCVVDKEGFEIARLLAARGVTAFVLYYRLPADGWLNGYDVPLADAQRAIRLIRHRAAEMKLDSERVIMMGFSAGGHVAASLLTRFDAPVYKPVDAADNLSARPDAAAPIYPVVSMDPAITHAGSRERLIGMKPSPMEEAIYSPDRQARPDMPPLFLLHAEDDKVVSSENSVRLRAAAAAVNVPCETHLFEQGGHGFGLMKTAGLPVSLWPQLLWNWMRSHALV